MTIHPQRLIEHRGPGADIFADSPADCTLVIPVNTVGVMGAGLAKEAARRWPWVESAYRADCRNGLWSPGDGQCHDVDCGVLVYLMATKDHWRYPSRPEWIWRGLLSLLSVIDQRPGAPVCLPAIGAGLGGLPWDSVVLPMIRAWLPCVPEGVEVHLYWPR